MSSSSVDWKRLNSPFPAAPRALPTFRPSLHFHEHDAPDTKLSVGSRFIVTWETMNGGRLLASHTDDPEKVLWVSRPGQGFVVAASGEAVVEESRGSFAIHDTAQLLLPHQVVTHVGPVQGGPHPGAVEVRGFLCSDWSAAHTVVQEQRSGGQGGCPRWRCWVSRTCWRPQRQVVAPYCLTFCETDAHRLTFHLRVAQPSLVPQGIPHSSTRRSSPSAWPFLSWLRSYWQGSASVRPSAPLEPLLDTAPPEARLPSLNRVGLVYTTSASERFFGFGEQFSHFDLKGRRVSLLVQEQGLGRSDQPITAAANLASHRSGGSQDSTYAPVPFYITSQMRALFLDNHEHAVFDLTAADRVAVHVHAATMRGSILVGATPPQLIERYTAIVGRMRRLPDWITGGAIVGMQGGTERVLSVLETLAELGVPVAAVWLQDWCGQRKTSFGKQLWWNWELDVNHYSGWHERLRAYTEPRQIRIMTYVNPYLADVSEKPNTRRSLLAEAMAAKYLVATPSGSPYFIQNTSFHAAMVDLTNPAAAHWLKQVIKAMLHTCGVSGYMADFGEALPFDACLSSGESPETAHNRYPELWARLNAEVFQEYAAERREARRRGQQRPDPSRTSAPPSKLMTDKRRQGEGTPQAGPADAAAPSTDLLSRESVEWETEEQELPLTECLDQALPAARSTENLEALVLPEPPEGEREPEDAGDGGERAPSRVSTEQASGRGKGEPESTNIVQDQGKSSGRGDEKEASGISVDSEDDGVFFMRAGFRGSPAFARLFWLGDQMVSWQRHDGIKSAVTGLLTGGLAGYAYNHSDIGGYTTVVHPLIRYRRSEELLMRWMELNAFTTIFRTHEGNIPGANVQFYSSPATLAHFRRCALLYQAWHFYRRRLIQEAAETGLPVVRHLFLHYPTDPKVWKLTYEQFLVGTELLVVPVLDRGATSVAVYLPATEAGEKWRHVWSGKVWAASQAGKVLHVEAPMGQPAVFVKVGSSVGDQFEENLRLKQLV